MVKDILPHYLEPERERVRESEMGEKGGGERRERERDANTRERAEEG